jgi:hypothetical protein
MSTATLKLFFVFFSLALASSCSSPKNDPQVDWQVKEIDLGQVKQRTEIVRAFAFTNVGQKPLLIREVKPSCGCTAVDWTRHPIGPGEKGEVRVRYRASANTTGVDLKHITVMANTKPDFTNLYLKAKVVL